VTNRSHRLSAILEIPDEGNGVLVGAQQIGIDLIAGNDQCSYSSTWTASMVRSTGSHRPNRRDSNPKSLRS
jgi:hypothetical protein